MEAKTIVWYFISAIFAAIPVPLVKMYIETKNILYIFASLLCYVILIISYSVILIDANIAFVSPIVKQISIIFIVFFGIIIYDNEFDVKTIVGLLLGLISIYLLSSEIK